MNAAFIYLLISSTFQVWANSVLALPGAMVVNPWTLYIANTGTYWSCYQQPHKLCCISRSSHWGPQGKRELHKKSGFLEQARPASSEADLSWALWHFSVLSNFMAFPPQALEDASSWPLTHKWVVSWKTSQGECWNVFYASCPTSAGFTQESTVKHQGWKGSHNPWDLHVKILSGLALPSSSLKQMCETLYLWTLGMSSLNYWSLFIQCGQEICSSVHL